MSDFQTSVCFAVNKNFVSASYLHSQDKLWHKVIFKGIPKEFGFMSNGLNITHHKRLSASFYSDCDPQTWPHGLSTVNQSSLHVSKHSLDSFWQGCDRPLKHTQHISEVHTGGRRTPQGCAINSVTVTLSFNTTITYNVSAVKRKNTQKTCTYRADSEVQTCGAQRKLLREPRWQNTFP